MAVDKRISELPDATLPIAPGVKFEAVQGGVNVKVDAADMPGSGGGTWGSITGTLSNQTDLQTALDAKADLTSASTSTAGGTITLDMTSQKMKMFVGSASFATPKTIAMSNTTGSLVFNLFINVTNVAAVITVPADWFMSDIQFDGSAWTPPETGRYELGGSFDGTNWWVKIQGPFS